MTQSGRPAAAPPAVTAAEAAAPPAVAVPAGPRRRDALVRLAGLAALGTGGGLGSVPARAEARGQAAAAASGVAPALRGARPRLVIVGAGWAALAALQTLRQAGAALDVTLVDRQAQFRALPLSSAWLAGQGPERLPRVDLATHVQAQGARFVAAEVQALDPGRRRVHSSAGVLDYDWLLLASGASSDDAAWYGGDARAQAEARQRFPAGFQADELDRLQQGLQAFAGGELLLTVPPPPYRCPPAPYERAVLLAGWIRARGLKARITLLDAGAGMPRYTRLFAERWRGLIEHRPYSEVRRVDPWAKTVQVDDGEWRFDHALLLPPMGAGPLAAQAGLLAQGPDGRPSRWAAVDAATLRSPRDARIFLAGDLLDRVSILFGAYPKTAQIAAELGHAAARQILAAALDRPAPSAAEMLPASQCHVWLDADPAEQLRIDSHYRLRGDGVIVQTQRQVDNPQPRGEDLQWARALLAARLGIAAG